MVSSIQASERDEVFRQARQLVGKYPVRFTQAGLRLDEIYSEEYVLTQLPSEPELGEAFAVEMTPERMRFMRLYAAVQCLMYPDRHQYTNHLDHECAGKLEDRQLAARMTILVILAAADPAKDEVVTEFMGEIASIPFEITELREGKEQLVFGGSCWIPWRDHGWEHANEPPPRVMERMQRAIDFLKLGASEVEPGRRIPTGDGRPCDQAGSNRFDETERALRDVHRYAAHFYWSINQTRRLWHNRSNEAVQQELDAIKSDIRVWWGMWHEVRRRAIEAIRLVDRPELNLAKQMAFDGLAVIAELYSEPIAYLEHESPGDHLFRQAHRSILDEFETAKHKRLATALDDLDVLRRGCLLLLEELSEDPKPENVQDNQAKPKKKRRPPRTQDEIEIDELRIWKYFEKNPEASRDMASEALGLPPATISGSKAWVVVRTSRTDMRRKNRAITSTDLTKEARVQLDEK